MFPGSGHSAVDSMCSSPAAHKDPRLRNRRLPLPDALKTPPPSISAPPPSISVPPPGPQYNHYHPLAPSLIPPLPYMPTLPPFFPPQHIGTPTAAQTYPLVPHGVLPPSSASHLSPEVPTTPKLTPARQTYGDFKRARAASQNSFDEVAKVAPSSNSYQQSPLDSHDRQNATDHGLIVKQKPANDWVNPSGPGPLQCTPDQLSQLVQFPPPAFYKEKIPKVNKAYSVVPEQHGNVGSNPPPWNMNHQLTGFQNSSGVQDRSWEESFKPRSTNLPDRSRSERPTRSEEKRDYEIEGGRDSGRSRDSSRRGKDDFNNRYYNGKGMGEQDVQRRGRDDRDYRRPRNDGEDRRNHYKDRERQGGFRNRHRSPVHHDNNERFRPNEKSRSKTEAKDEGQVAAAIAPAPVLSSVPVRRDIGGFFVRAIPTELIEEKKTAEVKRSSSRERSPRSRDQRRSQSRGRHRSRSRDRRRSRSRSDSRHKGRSRSRSKDRRRSRSRSKDRRRSRSRDRSRRSDGRNRSSRRSRSRGRGRRSRSRDRFRRSRSRGRSRRDRRSRSVSERSDSAPMSAFRRELAQNSQSRNGHREELIDKWRRLNCKTDEELERKLIKLSKMNEDQLLAQDAGYWIRSAPATTYYERDPTAVGVMRGTEKLAQLCREVHKQLVEPGARLRAERANCLPALPNRRACPCHKPHDDAGSSCSSGTDDEETHVMEELQRKMKHPYRLHKELWYNEPGEMNDGPLCKCSIKAKRSGIRHGIYAGEVPGVGIVSSVTQTSPFALTDAIASITSTKKLQICNDKKPTIAQEGQPASTENETEKLKDATTEDISSLNMNIPCCDLDSNNSEKLYNYRITITPPTNFLSKTPTIICHDGHEFIFTGFSLLSHYPLPKLPVCKVIRFNIEYRILYAEESFPENFTIRECNLFYDYLFSEILELVDLDLNAKEGNCPVFHFMPRFVRELQPEGNELLPMSIVMKYLLQSYRPLVPKDLLPDIPRTSHGLWLKFADEAKGMIVTKPGMKPSSIRVDQLDKDVTKEEAASQVNAESSGKDTKVTDGVKPETKKSNGEEIQPGNETDSAINKSEESRADEIYPVIVHFGLRPPQLSYAGNADYQQAWRKFIKHRHMIANLAKPSFEERTRLANKEADLQRMRSKVNMKRDVTTTVSSEGFFCTGIMCDVVQHAMLIPVLSAHLRFHRSLEVLEKRIGYTFKNRSLLQLALTHPSYRENFGTNPDHARNSLQNCGIRHPEYGDRRIHFMSTKKRGINTLMTIMSRFGCKSEEESSISHYERLEFLGDAVVEFVSTIHLFHIFRDLEEGGLATYRAALVQNQHLAMLAKVLSLDAYLLYAHGSDLCHDLELNHALANCFESLMGALYLDGGIEVADRVFSNTVFGYDKDLLDVWVHYPPHILQEQEPNGDRQWIEKIEFLKNLAKFEESIGFPFRHIRILARAFTDRSVGYTNLTLGSNQRMEFLGDSVLQLTASNYLYKHFPDHHEGHLSLLRSSLVNNNTQSVVCDDLGMTLYARYSSTKGDLKIKDRADLLEAFLGALYVDSGSFAPVEQFCNVCFFPRLQTFIMNQEWNDPKSKLQQCCLTLRTMGGAEPDIPSYKVVECKGPTNTRTYSVAVYFRGTRLATASGHSIQQAEMNAAHAAMENCLALFPQLNGKQQEMNRKTKNSKSSDKTKKTFERTGTPERYKLRKSSSSPSQTKSRRKSRSGSRRRSRSRSHKRSRRSRSRSNTRRKSRSGSRELKSKSKDASPSGSPSSLKRSVSISPAREVSPENNACMSPEAPALSLFSSWDLARMKARSRSSLLNPMYPVSTENISEGLEEAPVGSQTAVIGEEILEGPEEIEAEHGRSEHALEIIEPSAEKEESAALLKIQEDPIENYPEEIEGGLAGSEHVENLIPVNEEISVTTSFQTDFTRENCKRIEDEHVESEIVLNNPTAQKEEKISVEVFEEQVLSCRILKAKESEEKYERALYDEFVMSSQIDGEIRTAELVETYSVENGQAFSKSVGDEVHLHVNRALTEAEEFERIQDELLPSQERIYEIE